jgi:hypothetical protein
VASIAKNVLRNWLLSLNSSDEFSPLHRIAVSPRAYRAIKATLPPGSVGYPPERSGRGGYLLWLTEAEVDRATLASRMTASLYAPPCRRSAAKRAGLAFQR